MTASFPRLVATDLDGTIVRSDGTISPGTMAALSRVEAAGAQLVLVTGRPPRLMGEIVAAFGKLGNQGEAICSNGALIYDMHTGRVIGEHLIQPRELAEAAGRLRAAIPEIGLAVESADGLTGDGRYETGRWDSDVSIQRQADAELFGRPAAKLLGRHPWLSADDLLALAAPAVADIVNVYHSNGPRLVEASATGVSKASGLADLAERHGIPPAAVVAFGDMPNDLPMLAWAGTSYAVANAHPDVLAAADHVIASNDEDGVAQVIDRLFPPF
jgi:HAD superfamily hydrolase (TIGR01484 family)